MGKKIKQSAPNLEVKCIMCWTLVDAGDVEYGRALGCAGPFCSLCRGFISNHEWSNSVKDNIDHDAWDEDTWDEGTWNHTFTSPNSPSLTTWNSKYTVCHHNLTPYKLPQGTVYLSGYSALLAKAPTEGPLPKAAIYLSVDWMDDKIISNHSLAFPPTTDMDVTYVGWPDHGTVTLAVLSQLATYAEAQIKAGTPLEIACYGGHGRTGTLAAALGILGGMEYSEAITHLHTMYCDRAIETVTQEKLLEDFHTYVKNSHLSD